MFQSRLIRSMLILYYLRLIGSVYGVSLYADLFNRPFFYLSLIESVYVVSSNADSIDEHFPQPVVVTTTEST